MKLQIASDLHHEFNRSETTGIPLADGVDVLVLAGDIHSHTRAIDLYGAYPVPTIYVCGNHELYGADFFGMECELRAKAKGTAVHFLERDELIIAGVRFLGTCLWTDYCLEPEWKHLAMKEAGRSMNDHRLIRYTDGTAFSPRDAVVEHQNSRAWLEEKLDAPFDGKTVVVTHHAPHPNSIAPKYAGDVMNAAFASDLTSLVEKAELWIHGHVHTSFFYPIGKCRVYANPRGYPLHGSNNAGAQAVFENPDFDSQLVIDV